MKGSSWITTPPPGHYSLPTDTLIGLAAEDVIPEPLDDQYNAGPAVHEATEGKRLFTVSKTPLHGDEVTGSVFLLHDVTTLEHQRRTLAQQNERLDAFASTISHDLRNPLSVLSGYAEMARESGDPEHFDVIDETIETMDTFLEDLLVLARQGETIDDPEPVSLAAVAEKASADIASSDVDLTIVGDRTASRPTETGSRQVLSNLSEMPSTTGSEGQIRLEPTDAGFAIEDERAGHVHMKSGTRFSSPGTPRASQAPDSGWPSCVTS
ncbi:MAG: HAMP domain-containing sensor histidine kinase [Natrialbaceae archaeon]|nr:HAMP domain-containing sensor histidine kinase [Natrialbaceae archaeon]